MNVQSIVQNLERQPFRLKKLDPVAFNKAEADYKSLQKLLLKGECPRKDILQDVSFFESRYERIREFMLPYVDEETKQQLEAL